MRGRSKFSKNITNDERIKLLSRKYIKKLSNEEKARFEILQEKVRQLFPRATPEDFTNLELVKKGLVESEKENKRIRKKFNL